MQNTDKAIIDENKLKNYILSPVHPVGRFKAKLFAKLGYHQSNWIKLADDIRAQILPLHAKSSGKTKYGQKYTVTGALEGPNGNSMRVKSVWIVLKDEDFPRFVTIYQEK